MVEQLALSMVPLGADCYQAVADAVIRLKVAATRSNVERMINGLPAYPGGRLIDAALR